ncbi:hypothetical protein BGZ49_010674 [Haplosporangium sp. Z 27]|nr:hypothetical protein BGZ49_010674 [Haplosporangium sp. Z 27]
MSLLLVATAAMARPIVVDQVSAPSSELVQRSLIGDENSIQNQNDSSRGKQTYRVDHNGNSDVRKGLFYDGGKGEEDNGFEFKRRSLLGGLLGDESTSISNVNDNSKHTQTINEHGNKHIAITKVHKEYRGGHRSSEMSPEEFFDRRDLMTASEGENTRLTRRGLLFGDDSTSISNVNDNSQHTQTINRHGNKDLRITKKTFRQTAPVHSKNDDNFDRFFDRRDLGQINKEKPEIERRSILSSLFGGSTTTISNVNDNSQSKKTYNSHGNRETTINSKVHKNIRNNKKRGLLLGGNDMNISNENYNGKETKTFNSHGNVNKKISRKVEKNFGNDEDEWF